jgi:hypothetical protein
MGSILGSVLRGFAAEDAADKAKRAQKQNREEARRLYRQSRGSTGSAILPLYFGEKQKSFEREMARDVMADYRASRASMGSGADTIARYRGVVDELMPGYDDAQELSNRLLSGELTSERVGYYEPVFKARKEGAATSRAAGIQALHETLNEIEAMQARRGFGGDSMTKNLLKANVGRKVASESAARESEANLLNAQDEARLRSMGLDQRLASTSLPYVLSQQGMALEALPEQMLTERTAALQQPLNWFRIGNYVPNIPQRQPIPGSTQIWLNTGAEIADTVADIALSYFGGSVSPGQTNNGMEMPKYQQSQSLGAGGSGMRGDAGSFDFNQDYNANFGGLA